MDSRAVFILFSSLFGYSGSSYQSSRGYVFTIPHRKTRDNQTDVVALPLSEARNYCLNIGSESDLVSLKERCIQDGFAEIVDSTIVEDNLPQFDYLRINARFFATNTWTWVSGRRMEAINFHGGHQGSHINPILINDRGNGKPDIYAQFVDAFRCYICEYRDNRNGCSLKTDERCYQISSNDSTKLRWYEARNVCLSDGGDLASFETVNQLSALPNLAIIRLLKHCEYWIGGQRGVWRWNDTGAEVKYTSWADGLPGSRRLECICLNRSSGWKWVVCDCNRQIPFICATKTQKATLPYKVTEATTVEVRTGTEETTEATTLEVRTEGMDKNQLGFSVGLGIGAAISVVVAIILVILFVKMKQKTERIYEGMVLAQHDRSPHQTGRIPSEYVSVARIAAQTKDSDYNIYDEVCEGNV